MATEQPSERTYRWVNRTFATLYRLLFVRITVRGAENLPTSGPAVIACNHVSLLDFTFAGYAARERHRFVRFMCKRSIFTHRFAGPFMRAMRHIPVDRPSGAVAYRHGLRLLAAGDVIGVFPEATISRSFELRPFKQGAAALAIRGRAPLIPVIVWGSQRIATVDGHGSLRPGTAVLIHVGEPLHAEPEDTFASLTERLRARMQELHDDAVAAYPQHPRGDADRWWLPSAAGGTAPDRDTGLRLDHEGLERVGELFD